MWYFSWILGVLLACSLGIINVLRLEAQEALAKEHEHLDSLTQLLTRESMLRRLEEKLDNSRRNGCPFSMLYLNLSAFKVKHVLMEHEFDTILLKVTNLIKKHIRLGIDLAARINSDAFVLALPGLSLNKAEEIAEVIRCDVLQSVSTPQSVPVEIKVGALEYSKILEDGAMMGALKVDAATLLELAEKKI